MSTSRITTRKPTQYESLTAGIIAGAVEGAITYPAEFVKTRAQFTKSSAGAVSFCPFLLILLLDVLLGRLVMRYGKCSC